jgi:hypothetical protein
MKAERLLLTMIVAEAILVTPSVLTSPVLAQGTADEEDGKPRYQRRSTGYCWWGGWKPRYQRRSCRHESPSDLYDEFQSCLETSEGGTGGTGAFATEDEIRDCFIEVGYTGTGDDNDEEEDEGDDEETNN